MASIKADPENGFDHKSQESIDYHLLGQPLGVHFEHEQNSYVSKKTGEKVERTNARATQYKLLSDAQLKELALDYGESNEGQPVPPLPDDAYEDWETSKAKAKKAEEAENAKGFSDDEIPW